MTVYDAAEQLQTEITLSNDTSRAAMVQRGLGTGASAVTAQCASIQIETKDALPTTVELVMFHCILELVTSYTKRDTPSWACESACLRRLKAQRIDFGQ